ncbi:MAG: hypothetical protein RSC25_08110 [Christensenella sp.]
MQEALAVVQQTFTAFNGTGMYMALFFVALIYIYMIGDKEIKALFFYPAIFILVVMVFNPIFVMVVDKAGISADIFWRVYWILPVTFILAYAATCVIDKNHAKITKVVVTILVIAAIVISGRFIFTSENFKMSNNLYKLPKETVAVGEILKKELSGEKVLLPPEMAVNMRLYDASIRMTYGRDVVTHHKVFDAEDYYNWSVLALYDMIYQEKKFASRVVNDALERTDTSYVVINENSPVRSEFENMGCREVGNAYGYIVYDAVDE